MHAAQSDSPVMVAALARRGIFTVPEVRFPADKVAKVQALLALPRADRIAAWSAVPANELPELERIKSALGVNDPLFNRGVKAAAERRMDIIDGWPAAVRELANEIGFAVVHAFYTAGITKAGSIRHLWSLSRNETSDGRPAAFGNNRPGKP